MPVRRRVVTYLAEQVVGVHVWNQAVGECATMPTSAYDTNRDAVDVLFERLVCAVDWNRLMLEATARHLSSHPDMPADKRLDGLCGRCVREALLAGDRLHNWPADGVPPDAVRCDDGRDWAAALAVGLKYRRPGQLEIRGRDHTQGDPQ